MLQPTPANTGGTHSPRKVWHAGSSEQSVVGSFTPLSGTMLYVGLVRPPKVIWDSTADNTCEIIPFPTDPPAAATDVTCSERRATRPLARDLLDAELLSYQGLPQGWDGYDAVAASPDAVSDALAFLGKIPSDIPLPYPQIAPDGEVGLYWRTEEVYAEVGFYGGGEYSYYARYAPADDELEWRDNISREAGEDGCRVNAEDWPEDLLLILGTLEG